MKEKNESQNTTPNQFVDWDARMWKVKAEFGNQAERILFSSEFNFQLLNRIESVYFNQPLSFENNQFVNFSDRNKLNFPGPIYTCESDNCGTGQSVAPNNILCDEKGREHLFIQPRTIEELVGVITAAYIDPFCNYGFDGNENWNLNLIREWWSNKNDLINILLSEVFNESNESQNKLYIEYLNNNAKIDLMKYAFFLETGKYPNDINTKLPEID